MFAFSVSPSSLKTAPKSAQKMDHHIQEHLTLNSREKADHKCVEKAVCSILNKTTPHQPTETDPARTANTVHKEHRKSGATRALEYL